MTAWWQHHLTAEALLISSRCMSLCLCICLNVCLFASPFLRLSLLLSAFSAFIRVFRLGGIYGLEFSYSSKKSFLITFVFATLILRRHFVSLSSISVFLFSHTRSLSHTLTHSLIHSLVHSHTRSLSHTLAHSLRHLLIHEHAHLVTHSLTQSLTRSLYIDYIYNFIS